jgi:hypothetical protein
VQRLIVGGLLRQVRGHTAPAEWWMRVLVETRGVKAGGASGHAQHTPSRTIHHVSHASPTSRSHSSGKGVVAR